MKNKSISDLALVQLAYEACNNAYAPFSNFKVGAALVTDTGEIFTGVNVESVSFGATICAERTAIAKAVSERSGRPWSVIDRIAVVSKGGIRTFPCGICRQLLIEFSYENSRIVVDQNGELESHKVADLLPHAFSARDLSK